MSNNFYPISRSRPYKTFSRPRKSSVVSLAADCQSFYCKTYGHFYIVALHDIYKGNVMERGSVVGWLVVLGLTAL